MPEPTTQSTPILLSVPSKEVLEGQFHASKVEFGIHIVDVRAHVWMATQGMSMVRHEAAITIGTATTMR